MRKVFYDLVQRGKIYLNATQHFAAVALGSFMKYSMNVFIPKSPCLCSCSCLCCYVLVLVVVVCVMESFLHTSQRLMKNSLRLAGLKTARLKGAMGNQWFVVEGYGPGWFGEDVCYQPPSRPIICRYVLSKVVSQHTELEHTSKPSPTGYKPGFVS